MVWPFDDAQENQGTMFQDGYVRPEQLEKLLNAPDLNSQTRSMAKGIDRDMRKVNAAGLDPQLTEPRSNLFWDLLDTLDAPRQGVAGVVDTLFRGDMFGQDASTGEDVGLGWRRGQKENTTFSDILRRNDLIDNPIARGVVGFTGDVLMDPLTYLSFGTGAAVKVGGRALTETGMALRDLGVQRLVGLGVTDTIEQSKVLDEVFRGVYRGQEALKDLEKGTSEAANAANAYRLDNSKDLYATLFKDDEVLKSDIFKKSGLNVGINLPFLGHLQDGSKTAVEELSENPGIVGQALRGFSKTIKPGRIDLLNLELSDQAVDAFRNINDFASGKLAELGTKVAQLPVVGGAAAATGEKLSNFFNAASDTFKKAFNRKALIGVNNEQLTEEYLNHAAGIKTIARDRAIQTLGEEGLRNADDAKDAWLLIDELGAKAAQRGNLSTDQAESIMRKLAVGREAADGDLIMLRDAFNQADELGNTPETMFRSELAAKLEDPNLRDGVKLMTTKLLSTFDELALQEAEQGIKHGFLEYYVTHKYKNLDRNPFAAGAPGKADSFTQGRKYTTLSDAFEQSGKVADIDIPQLLEYRIGKSLTLQAQRSYANRLMLENSLPEHIVQSLYQEAIMDPKGDAAKLLKRNRWDFQPVDLQSLEEGAITAKRARLLGKDAKDLTPDEQALLQMSHADFREYTHKNLFANGFTPKDAAFPDAVLGEIGKQIDIPGGGKMYLPAPVADAYKETIAARDLFKDKFGDSAIGRALVKATDTATSTFKKFVTIPFPAYWGQNFLGDRFRQMMGGLHAMDPGVQARTYSLLNGTSAIKNKAGQILDKPTIDRVIKENGMNYSVSDFIGAIDSFGDINIDKFLRTKKGMLDNLLNPGQKGATAALVTQAHDKLSKTFDGFFRVSEMVRRFEQGDNLQDAIRSANDMYFNYKNMTPIESSYFRRFYMFYGYMSKATRASFTDLVTNPGNLTLQLHGTRGMAELFSDPDALPTAEMADLKLLNSTATAEQLSHIVGKTPDGKPIFGRGFAAPLNAVMQQFNLQTPRNFSVGELAGAAMDSTKRTIQKQFATANPLINATAQIVSGKNLYFDKPLDSEFLRKLPSLNAAAERLAGYKHNELPVDLDIVTKTFLDAVPDGKGRLIANPGKMWILMNLVPGLGRATSMAGTFTNADIPTKSAMLRSLLGVNLDDTDVSRSYLATQRDELSRFMKQNSVNQRLKNLKEEDSGS